MATHLISDHYMWWDDYSVLLIYPYCWERMIECQFNSDLTCYDVVLLCDDRNEAFSSSSVMSSYTSNNLHSFFFELIIYNIYYK